MLIDYASPVAAPKSDPIFPHVKADDYVIATDTDTDTDTDADTDGAWRMAEVI